MSDLEGLSVYCEAPLDSTILVILMRGASADKRKALYKQCVKNGVVLESNALRDYEMPGWISSYYSSRGLEISPEAAMQVVRRGIEYMRGKTGLTVTAEPGALEHIAFSCGGDLRKALNAVEVLFSAAGADSDTLEITLADAKTVTQRSAMRYDRDGDSHFDCLSALMKSIRGSDPDAAIHYLARFLEAGDLPACCRRILCSACEDIGLAYPLAIPIVKACVDSALQLGLPEARLPLADAVLFLATCPKSNSGCMAIDAALGDVRRGRTGPIPRELQNVHADSAGQEREQGYLYPHNYPHNWVQQQYLPDALVDTQYYQPGQNKAEQAAKRYWDEIKGGK